jgi:hypothetical protein
MKPRSFGLLCAFFARLMALAAPAQAFPDKPVIVENKAGADGHTLLISSNTTSTVTPAPSCRRPGWTWATCPAASTMTG